MKYASDFVTQVGQDELFDVSLHSHYFRKAREEVVILEVTDPITLNQVVAQWREVCGGMTFFRGQLKLYDPYPLSGAFRENDKVPADVPLILKNFLSLTRKDERGWQLLDDLLVSDKPIREFNNGFKDVPEYALEGLFQHYEGGTRWLDIVDNLQLALWMATRCYRDEKDRQGNSIRIVEQTQRMDETTATEAFIHLYLFAFNPAERVFPGLLKTSGGSYLLDLREALPARFLRPHAQHSALLKSERWNGYDYTSDLDVRFAILRIPEEVATGFFGGRLLTVDAIFPTIERDLGFAQLQNLFSSLFLSAEPKFRLSQDELLTEYYDVERAAKNCDP